MLWYLVDSPGRSTLFQEGKVDLEDRGEVGGAGRSRERENWNWCIMFEKRINRKTATLKYEYINLSYSTLLGVGSFGSVVYAVYMTISYCFFANVSCKIMVIAI